MPFAYLCFILFLRVAIAQSSGQVSTQDLDSLLQDYAFKALARPRTGIIYNVNLPSNFTGIQAAATRLRSGSLRRKGVKSYKEFEIPIGVVEQPYVERVVLVYHNLGNWSSFYYPLPGYTFLAPVLGLLAYDAANLFATNLSKIYILASGDPISIHFANVTSKLRRSSTPKCMYFGLDGSVLFNDLVKEKTCFSTNQGHFSIVVESLIARGKGKSKRVWILFVSMIGGGVLLILLFLAMLFAYVRRRDEWKRRQKRA